MLIVIILVTFPLDHHVWVHDNNIELHANNVELYILTNPAVTFSTYLKINTNTNTNLPATTTTINLDANILFGDSFITAWDGLVSESEANDYSNDEYNEEEEDEEEPEDSVPKELPLPVQRFSIKHTQGKKVPSLKLTS